MGASINIIYKCITIYLSVICVFCVGDILCATHFNNIGKGKVMWWVYELNIRIHCKLNLETEWKIQDQGKRYGAQVNWWRRCTVVLILLFLQKTSRWLFLNLGTKLLSVIDNQRTLQGNWLKLNPMRELLEENNRIALSSSHIWKIWHAEWIIHVSVALRDRTVMGTLGKNDLRRWKPVLFKDRRMSYF